MALPLLELLPLLVLLAVVGGLMIALWRMRNESAPESAEDTGAVGEAIRAVGVRENRSGGARRRRGGLAGMRAAAEARGGAGSAGNRAATAAAAVTHTDGSDSEGAAGAEDGSKGRRKKDANREAKRAAREAREQAVAAQRERMDLEDQARAAARADEAEADRAAEEEAAAAAAEKVRKEEEEYAEWKGLISVEDAGDEGDSAIVDDAAMLERFVTYIRENKIVVLEELAAEFGLKTEDAIQRLTSLEEVGTVSGVFDDRGKFVYVSPEEMRAVADFIVRRGRVSISELAAQSAKLLALDKAATAL